LSNAEAQSFVLLPALGRAGFRLIFFWQFYSRFLTQYNTRRYCLLIEIADIFVLPELLNSSVPEVPFLPLREPTQLPSKACRVHSLTHWMKIFHMVVDNLRPLLTIPVNPQF